MLGGTIQVIPTLDKLEGPHAALMSAKATDQDRDNWIKYVTNLLVLWCTWNY
jgi:hypothetical protein